MTGVTKWEEPRHPGRASRQECTPLLPTLQHNSPLVRSDIPVCHPVLAARPALECGLEPVESCGASSHDWAVATLQDACGERPLANRAVGAGAFLRLRDA